MLREDCRIGLKVIFGRPNGEKTLGEITDIGSKYCKIKTLEERGRVRNRAPGGKWKVPFSLMSPADQKAVPSTPVKVSLTYNPFDPNNKFYELVGDIYAGLSPENLHQDGEASAEYVRRTRAEYNRQLKGIFISLGREVSEGDYYEWEQQRRDYQKSHKPRTALDDLKEREAV